jgi:hypothetical protein
MDPETLNLIQGMQIQEDWFIFLVNGSVRSCHSGGILWKQSASHSSFHKFPPG